MDHGSSTGDPDTRSCNCSHLTFYTDAKNTHTAQGNRIAVRKRKKPDPYSSPFAKLSPRWIKGFDIRPQTLKLLKGKAGSTFHDGDTGKEFLNRTLFPQETGPEMGKWDLLMVKETLSIT